jgi:chorismate-pyruvate lyase
MKEGEHFKTTGFEPDFGAVDWSRIPPFVRVLLATDGTVTKSLEAYFWEPVQVKCQNQRELAPGDDEQSPPPWPEVMSTTEPLWRREVDLLGRQTGTCYAKAQSVVRFTRLPKPLRKALQADELGIGGLIRALELETYRKIFALGQSSTDAIWRQYDLYYQGQPLMRIQETFNLSAF